MSASIYTNEKKKKTKIIGKFTKVINYICNTDKYYSMHSKFNTRNTNSERYRMQSPSRLRIMIHVALLATPGDSGTSIILMKDWAFNIRTNAIVLQRYI